MKKKGFAIIAVLIVVVMLAIILIPKNGINIKSISSESELYKIANSYSSSSRNELLEVLLLVPIIPFAGLYLFNYATSISASSAMSVDSVSMGVYDSAESIDYSSSRKEATTTEPRDYSETNVQVENVDEADITKTDGYYIYSISNSDVVITDVNDLNNIKIASRIYSQDYENPVDLIVYKDKLVVINDAPRISNSDGYYWYNYSNISTQVRIYDIKDRTNPKILKSFAFDDRYYTSRCIDNRLYIISSGRLKYNSTDKKVYHSYYEDNQTKDIALKDIKFIDGNKSRYESILGFCDLDNVTNDIEVTDYLFDISNAYVSEKAIYILDDYYAYYDDIDVGSVLKAIFSWKGVFGLADLSSSSRGNKTRIIKFDINKDGTLSYAASNDFEGKTINQYSLDEKDSHLRVAVNLGWNAGAKILTFDEKLKKLGETDTFGKNEQLYTSRFIGDKVYVVTYRNTDPLFVIDLSDDKHPKILGELKIPGYSTYLHPYDDNHIIGIGMETQEVVNRDSFGRVTSTSTYTVGMKMALFDVSDVKNPKEISKIVIGDSRTSSAVLSNPKALLFSKERNLIAIPANRYSKDIQATVSDYYSSSISNYTNYLKDYVAEGYLVYDISLEDGFKLRGSIEHPDSNRRVSSIIVNDGKAEVNYGGYSSSNSKTFDYYDYYYYKPAVLIRGLYINDNLYTVSQKAVYVNNLKTLECIDAISLDK